MIGRASEAAGARRGGRPLRGREVRACLREGRRAAGPRVVLYAAPGTPGSRPAFVVGRRVGKAVERNRARRVLRAAWDEVSAEAPASRIVLVARPAIRGAGKREMVNEIRDLLARIGAVVA